MTLLLAFSLATLLQTPPPPPTPAARPAQTPARDMPFRAPDGTASITGHVMSDGPNPTPLRRVTVNLRSDAYRAGWSFVTDDTGAFSFTSLPAGRYLLGASKPTYVTTSFGASKPGRPGQSIVLVDRQVVNVTVTLPKGAVITGTIRDEFGTPVPNAYVQIQRMVMRAGVRTPTFAGEVNMPRTDDRGVYRIYGLAAGEYVVWTGTPFLFETQKLRHVTAAEIDAALRRPGDASAARATPVEPQPIVSAPVYYPNTVVASDATVISVTAGEERTGIDIATRYVNAVDVQGHIVGPDGKVPSALTLTMMEVGGSSGSRTRFGRPSADGTFSFNGLTPGQYIISARAATAAAPASTDLNRNAPLFARADVTITGQKIPDVMLTLDAGASISGTVQSEGTSALDMRTVSVSLEAILGKNDVAIGVTGVTPAADGSFTIIGVTPGRYRATAIIRSGGPTTWSAKSAAIGGHEALIDGFDVGTADMSGLTVTMTDRATELTGTLQDASGRAAPDFYIIAFPVNEKLWFNNSRYIKTARPGVDGLFTLKNLPPGDYRIAAVTDVETNEWFEPSFLQQLVAASASLSLAEGEKKSFPLKIGG